MELQVVQNSAYSANSRTALARRSSTLSETSDGYIPMGDGYEDVSGYEPPTMMAVDNQAYSGQPHQMTVVAYSEEPPPSYDYIHPNSSQLYEQIPERVEQPHKVQKRVSMGRALCSFKQGKAEIGIRISILILGALLIILHGLAIGLVFTGYGLLSFLVAAGSGAIWPGLLMIFGCVELGIFFGRLCKKRTSKCFAMWDIVHSSILSIFYFLCAIGACASTAVLASEASGLVFDVANRSGSISGAVIFPIIIVLSFLQMTLYIVKACLVSAFINKGWDDKVEEYNTTLQARTRNNTYR